MRRCGRARKIAREPTESNGVEVNDTVTQAGGANFGKIRAGYGNIAGAPEISGPACETASKGIEDCRDQAYQSNLQTLLCAAKG